MDLRSVSLSDTVNKTLLITIVTVLRQKKTMIAAVLLLLLRKRRYKRLILTINFSNSTWNGSKAIMLKQLNLNSNKFQRTKWKKMYIKSLSQCQKKLCTYN